MVKVFVDGASRGNPGPAGIGFVVLDAEGNVVERQGRYVGFATNNQAEYLALIEALKACHRIGATRIEVFSDSELLVKQMNGEYAVRNPQLRRLHGVVEKLESLFERVTYSHVSRELNADADALANNAIDEAKGKGRRVPKK